MVVLTTCVLIACQCESYLRVAREINATSIDAEDILNRSIDFDTMEEDKTFAAMGITKTIGTVRSTFQIAASRD
jgi:hypothetical protein